MGREELALETVLEKNARTIGMKAVLNRLSKSKNPNVAAIAQKAWKNYYKI